MIAWLKSEVYSTEPAATNNNIIGRAIDGGYCFAQESAIQLAGNNMNQRTRVPTPNTHHYTLNELRNQH